MGALIKTSFVFTLIRAKGHAASRLRKREKMAGGAKRLILANPSAH
jgi:hypothetical protein